MSTVKLRFRPNDKLTPDEFLRLLFLRPTSSQHSRPSSRKTYQGKQHNGHSFHRSSSYLSDNLSGSGDLNDFSDTPFNASPLHRRQYISASSEPPIQDTRRAKSLGGNGSKVRDQAQPDSSTPHGQLNVSSPITQDMDLQQPVKSLPHVLAISGMENTTVSVQRSLWKLLTQNEFMLYGNSSGTHETWRLPYNFLVICVCPLGDTRERPPLHRSLVRLQAFRWRKKGGID